MQGVKEAVGAFILVAFVFAAASVICFASGQPNAMADCGNQMDGAAALCPFMSASVPAAAAASFGKEMALVPILLTVLIAFAAVYENNFREPMALARYRHSHELPPAVSFLNPTLKLISQGVLHSRVFGY